ncbi:MAG: hypothetical protein CMI35_09470 [Owenweeksia sp.]|nr:hypothetical protein [Owenweeksia sp.]|tara:strand:+ start:180 stop:1283 length:1104 start_codon:yes stop_codon:yes gene_type:complete
MHPETSQLLQLITLDIPENPPRELGFLDVVGHTTRETTICNVYRYFLDPETSPLISELLIQSLEELIQQAYGSKKQEKQYDLSGCEVLLEVATRKGRIDIVLHSAAAKSVVMIEAKIYHTLHNDLQDYWNKYDYPENQKAGIILTLEPLKETEIGNDHFINITHAQWLNLALQKGLPHELPLKDIIYFKDFVRNMNHLTQSDEMTEEIQFYFQHAQKIEKAIQTRKAAYDFVIDQLRKVAAHFNWILDGYAANWRHLWDYDHKATLYYTIYPESILTENGKVQVFLESYNKALPYTAELKKMLTDHLKPESYGDNNFQHLASKTYDIPNKDYEKLSDFLVERIKADFENTRRDMMGFLKDKDADRHG